METPTLTQPAQTDSSAIKYALALRNHKFRGLTPEEQHKIIQSDETELRGWLSRTISMQVQQAIYAELTLRFQYEYEK